MDGTHKHAFHAPSLIKFTRFGAYRLVTDLFTIFELSPLNMSLSVTLCVSHCACVDVHTLSFLVSVCVSVSAFVCERHSV